VAKSKTYELMVKIAGKTDSSLKNACMTADKNLAALGNTAKSAGKVVAGAAVAAATAVGTLGVATVKAAAEYETQLANVSTLLTGTEAEIAARTAEIGNEILDVSNRTGVATENLTDGMYQVISAFGDSADAAKILETAAKSAAAGNATTTDSVNLLSAVTKGYGDTSAEAVQKAADLSFATVRLGQTSFPELAASMGKVIPLASTLGVEQERLFGAMATLTGVTGSTAEVVTQLKATMQGFLSPSKNMTAALESLGYESGQALLESEGLQGALEALKGAVNNDELAFAGLFSSVEAQTAVLAMAGNQSENLASKTAEMYEATGAANAAFEKQTDTLAYDIQMIKNLGANFLTQLGTNILPYVRELAEAALPLVTTALERAGDYVTGTIIPAAKTAVGWVKENKDMILTLAKAAGVAVATFKTLQTAGRAVSAFKSLNTIFSAGVKNGGAFGTVIKLLGGKFTVIIAVVAAVAAAFMVLWNRSEKFRTAVMGIWQQVQPLLQAMGNMVTMVGTALAPVLSNLANTVLAGLETAFVALSPYIQSVIGILTNLIEFVTNVFSGNWSAAWQNIVNIFGNVFGMIVNLAKVPINAVISAINWVLSKINSISVTIPDWVPGVGGKTLGFNIPTIPALAAGGVATAPTLAMIGEGGEPEAVLPLSKLAALLDEWSKKPKPGGGTQGGGDTPIQFSPVFNFYGPTTKEEAVEAGRVSFAEFKRLYKQMKAEERRKQFSPT
jgi:TP901 family phage tail tape measure protein